MPISLLKTGTKEQIEKYSRNLTDKVGEGGGFIMSASTVLDDAEPELIRIWADLVCTHRIVDRVLVPNSLMKRVLRRTFFGRVCEEQDKPHHLARASY